MTKNQKLQSWLNVCTQTCSLRTNPCKYDLQAFISTLCRAKSDKEHGKCILQQHPFPLTSHFSFKKRKGTARQLNLLFSSGLLRTEQFHLHRAHISATRGSHKRNKGHTAQYIVYLKSNKKRHESETQCRKDTRRRRAK
jgi:hypothetical protein